jgi:hypothetical protein
MNGIRKAFASDPGGFIAACPVHVKQKTGSPGQSIIFPGGKRLFLDSNGEKLYTDVPDYCVM